MKTRTAIIILIILSTIVLTAMYFIYQNSRQQLVSEVKPPVANQQSKELSPTEKLIQDKIKAKTAEINKKSPEEIKVNGYTPDEADFILNPQKNVERELGIVSASTRALTQEEINNILNPKK